MGKRKGPFCCWTERTPSPHCVLQGSLPLTPARSSFSRRFPLHALKWPGEFSPAPWGVGHQPSHGTQSTLIQLTKCPLPPESRERPGPPDGGARGVSVPGNVVWEGRIYRLLFTKKTRPVNHLTAANYGGQLRRFTRPPGAPTPCPAAPTQASWLLSSFPGAEFNLANICCRCVHTHQADGVALSVSACSSARGGQAWQWALSPSPPVWSEGVLPSGQRRHTMQAGFCVTEISEPSHGPSPCDADGKISSHWVGTVPQLSSVRGLGF